METQPVPVRRLVAGAAYGAWMAVLVAVVVTLIGLIAREIAMRFYPVYLATFWGVPVHEVASYTAQLLAYLKAIITFFFLSAIALSCWWRTLPNDP